MRHQKLNIKQIGKVVSLFVVAIIIATISGIGAISNDNRTDTTVKALSVTNVTPSSGSTSGGNTITINGDFTPSRLITPTTMQEMTSDYCITMPNYPAPGSSINLTDTRNNQTYEIRKLADNNCWMVYNLKIGSETSTMTLTSDDTDLNMLSNPRITDDGSGRLSFTLPQIVTSGSLDYNDPGAYGPVTGDTGVGDHNYGYLYNWSAATAGENRTTMPGDGTNNNIAPNSICPKGWRMPTGGDAGEYVVLNDAMQGLLTNWRYSGAFKSVASGFWSGAKFYFQESDAYLWSSSAYLNTSDYARSISITSSRVYPDGSSVRGIGIGIRCLSYGSSTPTLTVTVTIDGVPATVVANDDNTITIIAPPHVAGYVDITITLSNGETITIPNGYEYIDETMSPTNPDEPNPIIPPIPTAPNTGRVGKFEF